MLGDDQDIALLAEDDVGNGAQAFLQGNAFRGGQTDAEGVGYDALLVVGFVGDFGNGADKDFVGQGVEHHFGSGANGDGQNIDFVDDAVHFDNAGVHYFKDFGVEFDGIADFDADRQHYAVQRRAQGGGVELVQGVLQLDAGGGDFGGLESDLQRVGGFRRLQVRQVLLGFGEGGLGQGDFLFLEGNFGGFRDGEQVRLEFG